MKLSQSVETAIAVALEGARSRGQEFATVEHLLRALLEDPPTAEALRHCGARLEPLRETLERFLDEELDPLTFDPLESIPEPSLGFQRVVEHALVHAHGAGKEEISGVDLVISIYRESDSHAVAFLRDAGVERLDVVQYVAHGVRKDGSLNPLQGGPGWQDDDEPPVGGDPLEAFCLDLTVEAREGRLDPLVGRTEELTRACHILCRRRKNNPLFVGETGVGKTAIAEGLAQRIVDGEVPEALSDAEVFSLDMGAVLAGTRYRGDFEVRIKAVLAALAERDHAVLFIDEIHTIVGAGAASGSSVDASNLLKPALAKGNLRCMGSTTFSDFRQHFEKDRALARRFQRIDVEEPSEAQCLEILQGLREDYEEHHGVLYAPEALEVAVTLAARHLHDRHLPDSAIDVIDEAGAAVRLAPADPDADPDLPRMVLVEQIEQTVARMAQIPARQVAGDERRALADLEERLQAVVFGQERAIARLVEAIQLSRAGLREPDKPIGSFLFTGPTGVGKTELAKQLAACLGINFLRFDMSEYMERHTVSRLIGAPPGYVGFDQGGQLTDAINKTPHTVLLLDEIEKAHPDLFNILLQVMDHGTLTDNNGRASKFGHVVLIMTSNLGARELEAGRIGFADLDDAESAADKTAFDRFFSPEFRNRLDARIAFGELPLAVMESIVDKELGLLCAQLTERATTIELTPAARRWLAEHGHDPKLGARPLGRLMEDAVKKPLARELLFGALTEGGHAVVDRADGDDPPLVFRFVSTPPREPEPEPEDTGPDASLPLA